MYTQGIVSTRANCFVCVHQPCLSTPTVHAKATDNPLLRCQNFIERRDAFEKWPFKDARRELSSASGADRSPDNFIDYSWLEGRGRKEIPGNRVRAWGELRMEQRQPLRRQRAGELRGCRRRHYKLQAWHFR